MPWAISSAATWSTSQNRWWVRAAWMAKGIRTQLAIAFVRSTGASSRAAKASSSSGAGPGPASGAGSARPSASSTTIVSGSGA